MTRLVAVGSLWLLIIVGQAIASPTYYAGTGHYYEPIVILHPVSQGNTWHEVKAMAEARSWLGVSGYLATVTSESENQFIANLCNELGYDTFYWLGGYQPDGSSEPDGNWQWITGETWTYENWKQNEPSDSGTYGSEDHVGIVGSDASNYLGQWNDMYYGLNADRNWSSYVVEYNIPEPATLIVMALGGLSFLRRWR